MRLQNIIAKYDGVYIDEIGFNENTFELEIDLFMNCDNREEFVKECNNIKEELEFLGYKCAYDDKYSEYIYQLCIII